MVFSHLLVGGSPGFNKTSSNTIYTSDATTTCDFVGAGAKQPMAVLHNDVEGISNQFDILLSRYYVTCSCNMDTWYALIDTWTLIKQSSFYRIGGLMFDNQHT